MNSTSLFGDANHTNTTLKPGCNPFKLSWCLTEHKIYLFQYLVGLPVITIGYCSSSLLCYTIFSMILGPWPQVCYMLCTHAHTHTRTNNTDTQMVCVVVISFDDISATGRLISSKVACYVYLV